MNLFKTLYFITLITLLNVHISYAESNKNYRPNDFLTKSLRNAHDTVKLLKLFTIGEKLLTTKPDSSIVIFNVILTNARKINNQPFVARSYGSIGTAHLYRANYNESEKFYKLALEEWTKLNNLKMIGGNLSNLGNVYWYLGKFDKAIDYYIKSMNIREKISDTLGIATAISNIGIVHQIQKNFKKANEYYFKSLGYYQTLIKAYKKNKKTDLSNIKSGLSNSFNNIGAIYLEFKNLDSASVYIEKSLKLREEFGDSMNMVSCMLNLGDIYLQKKQFNKSEQYLNNAKKISLNSGNTRIVISSYDALSNLYRTMSETNNLPQAEKNKLLNKALENSLKGIPLAKKAGLLLIQKSIYQGIANAYRGLKNYELSIKYTDSLIAINDSIFSGEKTKAIGELEAVYQTEKKQKEIELLEKDKALDKAEIQAKKNQQFMLFGGLILVAFFGIFMFNRFRVTRKQKNIIEIQKVEVEQQRDEINEKNQLITESIEYAKTIQEAIITTHQTFKDIFTDLFILFKPKDIVSGDFYWGYKSKSNKVFWAAADCTGHGVPGAFMTMIGTSLLNEIIIEKEIEDTNLILDELRTSIIQTMNKNIDIHSNEKMRNGMDIALCCWDLTTNKLSFSGANNPLFLVRNQELIELKGDKQPIGIYKKMTPFTKQTLQIQKGDKIYTFSDGYPDQMNEQESRLKIANFKKLVLETALIATSEQKDIFESTYERWKGNYDQMDDVVLIGVEI
jgi:serine phosphatase RsbU (regulator of sigma subunit)/Tfp pilus assembly protein PilF